MSRTGLIFAASWVATGGYWYLRNLALTGNPVYPAAFLLWPGARFPETSLAEYGRRYGIRRAVADAVEVYANWPRFHAVMAVAGLLGLAGWLVWRRARLTRSQAYFGWGALAIVSAMLLLLPSTPYSAGNAMTFRAGFVHWDSMRYVALAALLGWVALAFLDRCGCRRRARPGHGRRARRRGRPRERAGPAAPLAGVPHRHGGGCGGRRAHRALVPVASGRPPCRARRVRRRADRGARALATRREGGRDGRGHLRGAVLRRGRARPRRAAAGHARRRVRRSVGLPHGRRAQSSRTGAARPRRQGGDRADRRRDGAGRARRRSADLRVEPPGRRGAARRGRASAAPGAIGGAALAGARARGLRGGPSPVEREAVAVWALGEARMDPSPRARTTRVGESAFGDVSLSGYDGRAALTHARRRRDHR